MSDSIYLQHSVPVSTFIISALITFCRLKLQPAIRAPPKTSRTKTPTHNELRTR